MKILLAIVLFMVAAAVTVHFVLSRLGNGESAPHDDGIQEAD
jgi:hypothetical protein